MGDEPELMTFEQAQVAVLADATSEGRCPHCGRRRDDDHEKTFRELREALAEAREGRDQAQKDVDRLQDSNSLYEAEVASLKQRLVEVG